MARRSDYQYVLCVNGAEVARGDQYSIGVIFFNMQGRNFVGAGAIKHETHQQWLSWASAHFETALEPGMAIEMHSPQGTLLHKDVITLRLGATQQVICC